MKTYSLTLLLIFLVTALATGQDATDTVASERFKVVEKSATFPGGMNAFYRYISKNIKYPTEKKKKGDLAKIHILFVVNQDGTIDPESVEKYTGELGRNASDKNYIDCKPCEEEAIRLIKNSPKWIPGESNHKPIRQRMVIPVFFSNL